MIRLALVGWVFPVGFLTLWYALAANDLSFGLFFLSRELHDQVFGLYGAILGVDPALLPGMVAKAILLDSLIVGALVALRHRKRIVAWIAARRMAYSMSASRSPESLSSAP